MAGQRTSAMAAMPAVVPRPMSSSSGVSSRIRSSGERVHVLTAEQAAHGQEHRDHDHVVEHRSESGHGERAFRVEDRRPQRRQPVEEDLRHEHDEQRNGQLDLLLGVGGVLSDREEPDDQRGERRGHDRQCGQSQGHHRGQRVDRASVFVLEAIDDDRHERGGEDTTEHQVVDDVRRRVGEVVRVGDDETAEGIRRARPFATDR